ncbi:SpoIIE family protein phosphatase [Microbacterium sp. LRZ72]|uniref:PP2C family protein-serine/threonine phosphatase n=1 Tax=Microbacterium sp. LRZ72 TaxID=2942481 RepID=UPI0029B0F038|nr:GAF domain-containing SpoIIE family protein phosphatase [Microbacterium sp. LRZ72]MDX2377108.1 SpoIIE family protein phosphatase [Microbacterium sp. LRZ72]
MAAGEGRADRVIVDEETRQRALDALQILDTPPDERVDRVTRLAQELFGVPMVSVTLLDRDRQWRKSQIGLGGQEASREGAFCDATIRQDDTLVVEDASIDTFFADNPFVTGDPHLRFYAGHPLQAPGGEHVGTFCILDTAPRSLTERQREMLRDLALWVQAELARDAELDHASLIQRSLLPRHTPEAEGFTLAGAAIASGHVMGDFYDWYLHDGALRITLADVMGKGAGPAIVASGVRASLRTAPDRPLLAAIAEVDQLLENDIGDTNAFVTALHADLDLTTGELTYVDAGHSLAYILRRDGGWEKLASTGLPLGMGFGEVHTQAHTTLRPGDTFVCCSDGLLDVLDADRPLEQVTAALRDGPQGAVREAMRLARGGDATDDVTVVVVQRNP